MRQAVRIGVVAAAAATGILSMPGTGASATASSQGETSGSPGVLSGNSVAVPVSVPANLCGNSVDVVGALNPAFGNSCATEGDARTGAAPGGGAGGSRDTEEHRSPAEGRDGSQGYGGSQGHDGSQGDDERTTADRPRPSTSSSDSGAHAVGGAGQSPGVLSGNSVQAPVSVGANVCGNSVDVIGALNPAFGNECANKGEEAPPTPPSRPDAPPEEAEQPGGPPVGRALLGSDHPRHAGTPEVDAVHRGIPRARASMEDPATPSAHERLAETGADQNLMGAAALGAGLILGGGILYRRVSAARC